MKSKGWRALKIIEDACRHCQACMLACSMIHEQGNRSLAEARLYVEWQISNKKINLTVCRHCAKPLCMDDCPTEAMSLTPEGVVLINEQICCACGNCQRNCPFDAIIYIKNIDKYKKCDLCHGRKEGPVCVEICPVNAIILK